MGCCSCTNNQDLCPPMKKIFITYGNQPFCDTLKRLKKEAKSLGIFDKVITYTEKDLSKEVLSSPLMQYLRGGGYWVWKPYVILKTMQAYPDALIVYTDAGCSLNNNSEEWNQWFQLMQSNDVLVQAYQPDTDYGWNAIFGTSSTAIATWTKKQTIDYFDERIGTDKWHSFNKIWGGYLMICNKTTLMKDWLDTMLSHPELVIDPTEEELTDQYPDFVLHRHDQSILTALVYQYIYDKKLRICVMPETAESTQTAAVVASRIRTITKVPLKTKWIHSIKSLIGEDAYNAIHFWR